jgi:hypothetical protein
MVQWRGPLQNYGNAPLEGWCDIRCRRYETTIDQVEKASIEIALCQRGWII